jgi:CRP-like cAMP-binding protein
MEQIRQIFEAAIGKEISNEEWAIFSSKLIHEEFPKKHTLLRVGKVEQYLSFVETGIIRYFIPKVENDLTFNFVFENNFTSGYDSFITRNPSTYQIETLTPTVLWRISFADLQTIYADTEVGNAIGRKASEELYLKKVRRELSFMNERAEERYLNLFTEQPHLLRYIPLKYIASYIGVTPQALSRIRKRIT